MAVRHILFVEPRGDTLQRLLPPLGSHDSNWRIVRVATAEAALDLLSQRQFALLFAHFAEQDDACDGFLHQAQRCSPATIRYALAANAPGRSEAPALDSAYQRFATDTPVSEIATAIGRGIRVWLQLREHPALTRLLADLRRIPTPPRLYFEIREALQAPESDARSVADMVSRDPALTARILKVANSGFYALPRTISETREAIALLGTDIVSSLVLAAHIFSSLPVPGVDLDGLWQHGLRVSALSRRIAADQGGSRQDINAAGVAGLLHDLGQLILLANGTDVYHAMLRNAAGDETALLEMERHHFGAGHPELGAFVLSLWSLPDAIVDAVAHHHDFSRCCEQPASPIAKAVYWAEFLLSGRHAHSREAGDRTDAESAANCAGIQLAHWREACEELLKTGSW